MTHQVLSRARFIHSADVWRRELFFYHRSHFNGFNWFCFRETSKEIAQFEMIHRELWKPQWTLTNLRNTFLFGFAFKALINYRENSSRRCPSSHSGKWDHGGARKWARELPCSAELRHFAQLEILDSFLCCDDLKWESLMGLRKKEKFCCVISTRQKIDEEKQKQLRIIQRLVTNHTFGCIRLGGYF